MDKRVRRIFVEKKNGFDVEARGLLADLKDNLGINSLDAVRLVNRYDIEGLDDEQYDMAKRIILSEPQVDNAYDEEYPLVAGGRIFATEYLPGQYDQRADSAEQCIQLLTLGDRPLVRTAKLVLVMGSLDDIEFSRIVEYFINPVESRRASLEKPNSLELEVSAPDKVEVVCGFIDYSDEEMSVYHQDKGFAMSIEDILFCRKYFRDTEKRDPTITELKVLDTYWSDHCRHTTFLTTLSDIIIDDGHYTIPIKQAFEMYKDSRKRVYGEKTKSICLMDLATIGMKELKRAGKIPDLDESDEINACSVKVTVDVEGKPEEWLVMFKNETHNHPTEIEPFGGAATCLGGAIRDPLSGRSYVYQAMRVTGSGDPRATIADTLVGKLPQKKITTVAAAGYSSYGNQIGLATGHVAEIYHDGYIAKRMEIGAVVGATPAKNVRREKPSAGDLIVLLGGRTGRDGCGGATGSSKEHTEDSLQSCGAEVQKGNAPTERKIQRLFRKIEVSRLIKKCNDFGAGGVSVAIGELADGLEINLDKIPKKYEGLDGTELAISESQERLAVVVSKADADVFIEEARKENLEAVVVAVVTAEPRLKMFWCGNVIVDISREFLDSNGVSQEAFVRVLEPEARDGLNVLAIGAVCTLEEMKKACGKVKASEDSSCEEDFGKVVEVYGEDLWHCILGDLNVCAQKGLVERFDSTIGAATVNMPFGGRYQLSPEDAMVAKIPVMNSETTTGTIMAYGFNPKLSSWSPFHGAVYAIVEAVARVVAVGGDYKRIRLSLQEYFEKLGKEPEKWGKPFAALLGAYLAQNKFGLPAIGGKDSMSGTFKDLNVPPTLVAFAMAPTDVTNVISSEFKQTDSFVYLVNARYDEYGLPDFDYLKKAYDRLYQLICDGKIISARAVRAGGVVEAVSKMAFGNKIGTIFENSTNLKDLSVPFYGSVIIEISDDMSPGLILDDMDVKLLGRTVNSIIKFGSVTMNVDDLIKTWISTLEKVFPVEAREPKTFQEKYTYESSGRLQSSRQVAKPRVFIPVFPGTNCEYDTARAFSKAGALTDVFVINNMDSQSIQESVLEMARRIKSSQIIALPGGFSGGDEPDGSGKFIATIFRNMYVKDALMDLLRNRDGLILGICNGFQALIKLGLVPYGEISDIDISSPTLTYNNIGRHVSQMVNTKVVSNLSPWLSKSKIGDIHSIAVSHGEGRFVANDDVLTKLIQNGQIATQYVDFEGEPSEKITHNPNGSIFAVEGITSPCGRVFGKMGHSERIGMYVCENISGNKEQKIFESGVGYFG